MEAVAPCVVVCGPPCSGKTTFVLSHAQPGDLVVDHDLIARDLGSSSTHHHGRDTREIAEHHLRRLLGEIAAGHHPRWWVVRTLPDEAEREALATRLGGRVELLLPPRHVLYARAARRPRPDRARYLIDRWHERAGQPATRQEPEPIRNRWSI